jgi:DNA-directed RNA polymerase specialized sigma24 family protein
MGSETSDSALIASSCSSPDDFAVIFDRHFDAVFGYLQRRIGHEVAEDLTAETFLVGFNGRYRFDTSQDSARPWLLGIATNLFRHYRRREDATTGISAAWLSPGWLLS